MNSKKNRNMSINGHLKSNIKMRPQKEKFKTLTKKAVKSNDVSMFYYVSWGVIAVASLVSVSALVMNEGGIDNAIQTANFKKINRDIAANNLAGGDNLPTASIPLETVIGQGQSGKSDLGQTANSSLKDLNSMVADAAKNSSVILEPTSYAVFLGQSTNKTSILDLWYNTKNKNLDLFGGVDGAYYFDSEDAAFNLVVGNFENLAQSLKFCAELKFNDIACNYDQKYADLQTIKID